MDIKKITSVITAAALSAALIPQAALAYSAPDIIRIGLESVCKNAASVKINSTELLIGENEDGDFDYYGEVASAAGFTATPKTGDFIAIDERLEQDEADSRAEALRRMGLNAYTAFLGDEDWNVYVSGSTLSQVENAALCSAERVQGFEGVLIEGGGSYVLAYENAVFTGTERDDTFTINGNSYRGMLSFSVVGNVMTAVNIIDLEDYLYGVVPSEMPQTYETEALKAQAVAARTYTVSKLSSHTSAGYQLCDSTHCQVYKGYDGEAAKTNEVIDETAGVFACYNGVPIEAVFSASTGGYTENSENVWYAEVPYLRAVPEIAEAGDNSWSITLTLEDLDKLLTAKGENIGSAEDIAITKLSTGGRVQEMKIVGTRGEVTLTKENIRTYFSATSQGSLPGKMFTINGKGGEIGAYNGQTSSSGASASSQGGSLAAAAGSKGIIAITEGALASINGKSIAVQGVSAAATTSSGEDYEVYDVSISTVKNGEFVFEGVGKGHGVGMSQNGAQAMAKLGYSYEDILYHYYTGITIEG